MGGHCRLAQADLVGDEADTDAILDQIAVTLRGKCFSGSVTQSRIVSLWWLESARNAAVIQSLLATARANGLEPLTWLSDTLEKLPGLPNGRIDELLPIRTQEAVQG